jgi:hypothetical protein
MRRVRHAARTGQMRTVYKMLIGKTEGKRPLGRHRRRWEVNIVLDHRETRWESVEWIHVAQDREQRWVFVNTLMKLRVP